MKLVAFSYAIITVSLCVLTTACATPQDARAKGPVTTFVSHKPAREVVDCVATAWEEAYGHTTTVNIRPYANGYSLRVESLGNTQVMLDITDTERGSVSSYFKGNVFGSGRLDNSIEPCQ